MYNDGLRSGLGDVASNPSSVLGQPADDNDGDDGNGILSNGF